MPAATNLETPGVYHGRPDIVFLRVCKPVDVQTDDDERLEMSSQSLILGNMYQYEQSRRICIVHVGVQNHCLPFNNGWSGDASWVPARSYRWQLADAAMHCRNIGNLNRFERVAL